MGITFRDRVSTYPNRYKLKKSDGTSEYVTLERADVPTVVGTPLNADTFNNAFAPAGFGLGSAQKFTADEIDNITRPGFYYADELMVIADYDSNVWWMEVFAYGNGANYVTQRISTFWSGQGFTAERHKVGGDWKEWAWVNPPMRLGVEYRTTEYYATSTNAVKPVYVKRIRYVATSAFGSATTTSSMYVPHGTTYTTVVRCEGMRSTYLLPYFGSTGTISIHSFNASSIVVKVDKETVPANANLFFDFYYTK